MRTSNWVKRGLVSSLMADHVPYIHESAPFPMVGDSKNYTTIIKDLVSHYHNIIYTSSPDPFVVNGVDEFCRYLNFDGRSVEMNFDFGKTLFSQFSLYKEISILIWFRPTDFYSNFYNYNVLWGAHSDYGRMFIFMSTTNHLTVGFSEFSSWDPPYGDDPNLIYVNRPNTPSYENNSIYDLEKWQCFVFTAVNGGKSKLYRNGVLIGENSQNTVFYDMFNAFDGWINIKLIGGSAESLIGKWAQTSLYSRELTQQEVQILSRNKPGYGLTPVRRRYRYLPEENSESSLYIPQFMYSSSQLCFPGGA